MVLCKEMLPLSAHPKQSVSSMTLSLTTVCHKCLYMRVRRMQKRSSKSLCPDSVEESPIRGHA